MLKAAAALRRLTVTKRGFDECSLTEAGQANIARIVATGKRLMDDVVASPGNAARTRVLHHARYAVGVVVNTSLVLFGPSKRNPLHGAAVVPLAGSNDSTDVNSYLYSKHEKRSRTVLLSDTTLQHLVDALVFAQKNNAYGTGVRGHLASGPVSLAAWLNVEVGVSLL